MFGYVKKEMIKFHRHFSWLQNTENTDSCTNVILIELFLQNLTVSKLWLHLYISMLSQDVELFH